MSYAVASVQQSFRTLPHKVTMPASGSRNTSAPASTRPDTKCNSSSMAGRSLMKYLETWQAEPGGSSEHMVPACMHWR